ncbi:DNA-protecting protein DprA [Clostridium botulinum]|uniref:DNA-protecting protein DprA n=1 Tax=Clostridium botulinum TaxID=1491 RepID=A0A846JC93_CLOBO|nr:DNA-processing protein DprA [Clostridium botulinum]ACA53957.1 DNA protecting protein DprA [Clostridium botulinum A3 str. Loch Maree]NFH66726.1 DNA-protecting protein DprA [Clostridium botulinum]NFJ09677.1 DNA-protecting protein DprA [Clostridium botulinum]NFK14657.1 DNA-protecting protein DprA [Clostridium botulinum]NFM94681.1 DNA-protecting protein DprA [Clostridium botulinum]
MIELNLWYASAKVSNNIKTKLLQEFKSVSNIFDYVQNFKYEKNVNINIVKVINNFKIAWNKEKIQNMKNKILQDNIRIINYMEKEYPSQLRNYEDAPAVLFYKGNIEKVNILKSAAIVGSRKCSIYGMKVTKIISEALADNNIMIVSGMAKGIDYYAHLYCIENRGFTTAILGSGIDVVYPKQNKKIYDIISEDGCIISEFLPGTPPLSYNFPRRNRIISGLSDIVIVVEAGEKSGSLITTEIALEQGKDVVAVPGSIFSRESIGTNKIIKEGAYVFTTVEDILNYMGIEKIKINNNKDNKMALKDSLQGKVYNVLSHEPKHIDDLLKLMDIDIKHLYEVLFELQLKKEVICLAGNYYVKS